MEMYMSLEKKLYRVGALAKKSGKTTRTLRFYEQLGLLIPQKRTESGYRLYGEEALIQVQWIEQLQDMGFSLGDIKTFLEGLDQAQHRPIKMSQIRSFYEDRLRETRENIQKLLGLEKQLEYSLLALDPCVRCDTNAEKHHCRSCIDETLKSHVSGKAVSMSSSMPEILEPLMHRVLHPQSLSSKPQ
jgi:MerR family transcriptional regulator, copper efflux regulator